MRDFPLGTDIDRRQTILALPREPYRSTAFAVGSREWLAGLTGNDETLGEHIAPADHRGCEGYEHGIWFLRLGRDAATRLKRTLGVGSR